MENTLIQNPVGFFTLFKREVRRFLKVPVQTLIARWHQHLRYFYEPTPEILRGLGGAYAGDPAFAEFLARFDPGLPDFMHRAIDIYCSRLAPEGRPPPAHIAR